MPFHPIIYLFAFLGVFFEGEFAFISAIVAAEHSHLAIPQTILIGFLATLSADCFYFFLGQKKGSSWLDKNQKISKQVAKAKEFIAKKELIILISYRYLYGLRTLIPLVLGTLNTPPKKFLLFSFFGTLIWTAVFATFGIVLNRSIMMLLSDIEHVEKYLIAALVIIASGIIGYKLVRKKQFPFNKNLTKDS
jgi:membrane protein DedA with SNARE-associated domain